MKKILCLLVFCASIFAFAQKEMPNISLKSQENKTINVNKDFAEKDKIYVFSFWATWCAPCINELEAINELYEEWQKEINVEVIAVSIDDARTAKRVKPLLNGKNWPYTVLLDTNQDLKRALSIVNVPYTIVVKNQKIVHIQNGYTQGEEKELFEKLKNL
jgi:peroxiredoxin